MNEYPEPRPWVLERLREINDATAAGAYGTAVPEVDWIQPTPWLEKVAAMELSARGNGMVQAKTTIWVTREDEARVEINDDGELTIVVPGVDQAWDVVIDPGLFDDLRAALNSVTLARDEAEGAGT